MGVIWVIGGARLTATRLNHAISSSISVKMPPSLTCGSPQRGQQTTLDHDSQGWGSDTEIKIERKQAHLSQAEVKAATPPLSLLSHLLTARYSLHLFLPE